LTFNGLHGVIFQKIELFITTAAETSNPIFRELFIFKFCVYNVLLNHRSEGQRGSQDKMERLTQLKLGQARGHNNWRRRRMSVELSQPHLEVVTRIGLET
jgi:hypothetical protein